MVRLWHTRQVFKLGLIEAVFWRPGVRPNLLYELGVVPLDAGEAALCQGSHSHVLHTAGPGDEVIFEVPAER
jgi:hypothetical protein